LTYTEYLGYIWSNLADADNGGKEMNKNQKETKLNTRMLHIRLPEELHKKVRIRAAEDDKTIQDWVVEAIDSRLQQTKHGDSN
jgi:predicted HicB family RNase H-like nuclease